MIWEWLKNRFTIKLVTIFITIYLDIKKVFHVNDPSGLEQVAKCLIQFIEIVGTFTNLNIAICSLYRNSVSLPAKLLKNMNRILILKRRLWNKWTWKFLTWNEINIRQDWMCIKLQELANIYISENKHLRSFHDHTHLKGSVTPGHDMTSHIKMYYSKSHAAY